MKIASLDPLYVEVIVPASYYGVIKKGALAEIIPEESLGGKYSARVVIVDQVMDAASGTFGVRLVLSNPGEKLPAGVKCRVLFK